MILWSGGCDSTLLLHDLAVKQKMYDNYPINAVSIIHDQIYNSKTAAQGKIKILKELRKRGLEISYNEIHIKTSMNADGCGLTQPIIWLATAIPYLGVTENMYVGYIKEDCVWHYRSFLYDAFKNLQTIRDEEVVEL